jgi:hypothetical protein
MSVAEMMPQNNRECGPCQNGDHWHCVSRSGTPCPCEEPLEDGRPCSELAPIGFEGDPTIPRSEEPIPTDDDGLFAPDLFEPSERPVEFDFEPEKSDPVKSLFSGGIPPPRRVASEKTLGRIIADKLLSDLKLQAYKALFECGPCTAQELTAEMRQHGIHKRLPELERLGVVRRIGRRKCSLSGKNADLWDVTDKLPQEASKPLLKTHLILSVGSTIEGAIKNFAEPVGWKVKELVDGRVNPRYYWQKVVTTESGESFEAAGQRVPGGYVMTLWK